MNTSQSLMVVAANEGAPCGILDYTKAVIQAWPQPSASLLCVASPHGRVARHRVLTLWRLRRRFAAAARRLPSADLLHVQYADFGWNGTRPHEDCYDVFSRHCRSPMAITLHEHPWLLGETGTGHPGTVADRVFLRLAGGKTDQSSFRRGILLRHKWIHVHHRWHRDQLLNLGIPAEKIRVFPLPIPECPASPAQVHDFACRFGFAGKRVLVMAGFVFDRKRYERAIALLPCLPEDVVLCALGGANGPSSEVYCRQLRQQAEDMGVGARFVVTGYVDENTLNAGLTSAAACLAPYSFVTSSASLARCIGGGAPIIAERCVSFVELEQGSAGVVCAHSAVTEAWGAVVRRVLDDPGYSRALREKNARYAQTHSYGAFARELCMWHAGHAPEEG